MSATKNPLVFNILAECSTSKARTSKMILPHGEVDTPVFMPVGTQVNSNYIAKIHPQTHTIVFRVL